MALERAGTYRVPHVHCAEEENPGAKCQVVLLTIVALFMNRHIIKLSESADRVFRPSDDGSADGTKLI